MRISTSVIAAIATRQNVAADGCAPDDWVDALDEGCAFYKLKQYCTADGGYGPGWRSSWGTFRTYKNYSPLDCVECGCGATAGAADESDPCPSATCWDYDSAANSCTMKSSCYTLTCGATAFDLSFDQGIFNIKNNDVPTFENGAVPTWDGTNWNLNCPLGDHDMTYSIDSGTNEITFTVDLNVIGNNRLRSDSIQDNVINLGANSIVTTPYGAGTSFSCAYSMSVDVSSESFTVGELTISDSFSGTGALTDGFELTMGSTHMLGATVTVGITWSITGFSELTFSTDECTITHGSTSIAVIKDKCYGNTMHTKPGTGADSHSDEFSFRAFKGTGEAGSEQWIDCTVSICENSCSPATTCPSTGDDALYGYSVDGN